MIGIWDNYLSIYCTGTHSHSPNVHLVLTLEFIPKLAMNDAERSTNLYSCLFYGSSFFFFFFLVSNSIMRFSDVLLKEGDE